MRDHPLSPFTCNFIDAHWVCYGVYFGLLGNKIGYLPSVDCNIDIAMYDII